MKNRKNKSLLIIFAWGAMFMMIAAMVAFGLHLFSDDSNEYGMLITSIFAALFSGLNVLAFYHLTIEVERQNSEREDNALRIDGLKYQLENQKTLFEKVEKMQSFIIKGREFEIRKMEDLVSIDRFVNAIKDEMSTIQLLDSCDTLFPSLSKDNIKNILDLYKQATDAQLIAYQKFLMDLADGLDDGDIERYKSSLAIFWQRNTYILLAYFALLIAQMQYDIQCTLTKSIGQNELPQPSWQNEQNAVLALKALPLGLDAARSPSLATPAPILYQWDLSYIFPDEDTSNAPSEEHGTDANSNTDLTDVDDPNTPTEGTN